MKTPRLVFTIALAALAAFMTTGLVLELVRFGLPRLSVTTPLGLKRQQAQLTTELKRLQAEVRRPGPSFPEPVVSQAKEVGLEARRQVAGMGESGTGTAWFIAPGLLVTSGHSVAQAKGPIPGQTFDGDRFEATVVNFELEPLDLAVLKTDYTKLPGLPLGSSQSLQPGDPLIQIGHPGIVGQWIISLGPVSQNTGTGWILSQLPTLGGSSGSVVLSLDGQVVGMTGGTAGGSSQANAPADTVYQEFKIDQATATDRIEEMLEKIEQWTGVTLSLVVSASPRGG